MQTEAIGRGLGRGVAWSDLRCFEVPSDCCMENGLQEGCSRGSGGLEQVGPGVGKKYLGLGVFWSWGR